MTLDKIHEITFDTDESIVTVTISNSNELVMLMNSGSVIRYKIRERKTTYLFSVKSDIGYADSGFDINTKSTIYTMDEIVVVVNDYKRHGFVHYPQKYQALHLWREDYHAGISAYPIALFKNEEAVPYLIFGIAWNHIQIMNLETRQVITAAKSLIKENAEEQHIEFYKTFSEDTRLPWPRPYDYFFGKLLMSPDHKKFLSAGWTWGPSDSYNVYDIKDFMTNNRIKDLKLGNWEHENRATCWMDNNMIAVVYDPFTEGDDYATAETPCEMHFYKIDGTRANLEKKIPLDDRNILNSTICYNKIFASFVSFTDGHGLSVISLNGQITFKDESLKIIDYNNETGLLLTTDNKTVSIYKLTHPSDSTYS